MNQYVPLKIDTPPEVDGKLTDTCWKNARRITGFEWQGKQVSQQSSVMICYDSKNLYIGIECQEDNVKRIKKNCTKHGDPVWVDDCIEVFIAPGYINRKEYYHFASNVLGTRFTQEKAPDGYWPCDIKWLSKANVEKNKWSMEISIPLASLGITTPDLSGMCVCRERHAGKDEYSYWPIGGEFHDPAGHLLFSSYRTYLDKRFVPIWEEEKLKILREIKDNSSVNDELRKKVIDLTKLDIRKRVNDPQMTPEKFNHFLDDMAKRLQKLKELKRNIKFKNFIKQLKKLI